MKPLKSPLRKGDLVYWKAGRQEGLGEYSHKVYKNWVTKTGLQYGVVVNAHPYVMIKGQVYSIPKFMWLKRSQIFKLGRRWTPRKKNEKV